MPRLQSYTHTITASYLGYITQAVVNNFAPLLFLTFAADFALSLQQLTLLTTLNFLVQLLVDLLSARLVDRIGYRVCAVAAHVFAALGLAGLAVFPSLAPNPYPGILAAVVLYAMGGGLIEVLISPIVESCPTKQKEAAMSLLHSFYCWGQVFVVLASTLFFRLAGISHWRVLALLWALLPALNGLYFALVPIFPPVGGSEPLSLGSLLRQKVFWILAVLMVAAGASELAMSQWASAFAETALHISKTAGDLAGPCAFALLMGTARALYAKFADRLPLPAALMGSGALCLVCYLLTALSANPVLSLIGCAVCGFSVGIFWPGTFSLAAQALPAGGTSMYALLALAGDMGCSLGPTLVGFAASASGKGLPFGLLLASFFPVLLFLGVPQMKRQAPPATGAGTGGR